MTPRGGWLYETDQSPARRLALAPLHVASWLYGVGARLDRGLYQRGWRRRRRLTCKVVCVGNITVGGSGKTPTAAWLASALRGRGHKTVLATRGYGREGRAPVEVVSDGRHVWSNVASAGDEPLLLAGRAPGVPVLVGRDRGVVGLRAVSAFGAEILVLDDGFQHHRLARDLDLVLVDGGLGFGNRRLLPRGPLREPLGALRHADVVGVVDGPLCDADARELEARASDAFRFRARRTPAGLRPLRGGELETLEPLAGSKVGMLTGIARPESLRHILEGLGAEVVAERCYPDHHRFRPRDLRGLAQEAPLWVTTEKDGVKILPAWVGGADVRVLVIDLEVEAPDVLLDWIEVRLR